jgi:hypothetical protein
MMLRLTIFQLFFAFVRTYSSFLRNISDMRLFSVIAQISIDPSLSE